MNEMLANQYYLSRQYKDAMEHFEKALAICPTNNSIKKKLIICYIQTNKIELALELFEILISEEIEIILNSNSNKENCPCKQIIYELENFHTNLSETEKSTVLGILWLYCDRINSQKYFKKLLLSNPENLQYKKIHKTIKHSIYQINKEY